MWPKLIFRCHVDLYVQELENAGTWPVGIVSEF